MVQLHLLTFIVITYWIYLDQKVLTRVPATVLSLKVSCLSAIFGGDKNVHVLTRADGNHTLPLPFSDLFMSKQ